MKRSVSPQTVQEDGQQTKKSRISSFFESLASTIFPRKQSSSSNVHTKPSTGKATFSWPNNNSDNSGDISTNSVVRHRQIDDDDFPNAFTSAKRRSSLAESLKRVSDSVPRSLSVYGNDGGYQAITHSLQTGRDSQTGDSQQRRSSILPRPLSVLTETGKYSRDITPDLYPQEFGGGGGDSETESMGSVEPHGYVDEFGNSVRPPFINLDPRERHELLQLKRSIDANNAIQKSLKYMVNPHETYSVAAGPTRVNTVTQTQNSDFLRSSMNYATLLKLKGSTRRSRRAKQGKGFFSGEFYYEPEKPKAKPTTSSAKSSLEGALSHIHAPQFPHQDLLLQPKRRLEDQDPPESSTTGSRNIASDFLNNLPNRKARLDSDYVEKADSIFKVKLPPPSDSKKPSVGPSLGFKLDINKSHLQSLVQERKNDDESVEKAYTEEPVEKAYTGKKGSLFGSKENENSTSRGPLFGSKANEDSTSRGPLFGDKETKKPFSFGAPKDDKEKSVPETKATFSFGAKKETSEPPKPKPAFSFGSKKEDSEQPKPLPAFSFGAKKDDSDEPSAKRSRAPEPPKFSFGQSEPKEAPKETPKETTKEPPKFSFGQSEPPKDETEKKAPVFSFGAKNDDKKLESLVSKPLFSFGGTDGKTEAPKFSFGEKKEAPKFSFGEKEPPKISLGEKEPPKFSFGEKEPPKISLGEKKESTPFSFGSKASTPGTSGVGEKPKFSFGNTQAPTLGNKPSGFSFGNTPNPGAPTPGAPKPAFSFGQSASIDPALIFGASAPPSTGAPTSTQPATGSPAGLGASGGPGGPFSKASTPFGSGGVGGGVAPFTFGSSGSPAPAPGAPPSAGPVAPFGNNIAAPQPTATFGQQPPTNNAFSRGSTPGFGGGAGGGSAPGGPAGFGAPQPAFNFGGAGGSAGGGGFQFGASQPAGPSGFNSAPGSLAAGSRENTPPVFGGTPGPFNASQQPQPGQPFTPPLAMQGRKIAQMRPRRR